MMIKEGEDFTCTVGELTFSATEEQEQDWLQSIYGILDTACTRTVVGEVQSLASSVPGERQEVQVHWWSGDFQREDGEDILFCLCEADDT